MKILQNKTFTLIICLLAIVVSGLIFANRALGNPQTGYIEMNSQLVINSALGIDMNTHGIGNLRYPSYSGDATNKEYVDKNILKSFTGSDPASPAVGQMWLRLDQ